jgi:hypothetical protein
MSPHSPNPNKDIKCVFCYSARSKGVHQQIRSCEHLQKASQDARTHFNERTPESTGEFEGKPVVSRTRDERGDVRREQRGRFAARFRSEDERDVDALA